jgi:hypothetical protein
MPADNIEQTAREMGWRPKEEFRGDEEKWVTAQEFVNRGENFIPILRKDRDNLREENAAIKRSLQETRELLQAHQESVEELRRYHTVETERRVKAAKADLARQLKEAREVNDVDSELLIQEQLSELNAPPAPPPPKPAPAPAPVQIDPTTKEWMAANPWFDQKPRLRSLAMGIAQELKQANPTLDGKAFYAKLDEEMAEYLEPLQPVGRPTNKVGSGRTGAPGGSGIRTRTYADLPAEAKAACDEFASKLVGKGRIHADLAAWQAEYTKQYFEGEAQ